MSQRESHGRALSRRSFLKTTAATAGAATVLGAGAFKTIACAEQGAGQDAGGETITTTICRSNCSQGCLYNVHKRDGKVVKLSPKAYENNLYTGCCLRGLSMQERTYSDKRIKYPMRRTGERGSGQWERISWDEAISEVASNFKAVQDKYGKQALVVSRLSGNSCSLNGAGAFVARFANATEATLQGFSIDQAFEYAAFRVIGTFSTNETADSVNAKNIVVWGFNPVWTSPQTWRTFLNARDHGAKITVIDPLFSASAAKADRYIPVKAGTDALIALALLNKVLSEKTYDEAFCKTRSTAPVLVRRDKKTTLKQSDFDSELAALIAAGKDDSNTSEYAQLIAARAAAGDDSRIDDFYVWDNAEGKAVLFSDAKDPALFGTYVVDGIECDTVFTLLKERVSEFTCERAVKETGISQDDLDYLYDIYTCGDPLWLAGMYGIDHYWNGHLWSYAACELSAITGNVGKHGATYGSLWNSGMHVSVNSDWTTVEGKESSSDLVPNALRDVIVSGKYKGEDFPIKAMLITSANTLSNEPDRASYINEVLPKLDFVVTMDIDYTDSARYSDIVLPASYWLEQEDFRINNGNPYLAISEKAIDSLYESKCDFEILTLIAQAMGLEKEMPTRTAEEWLTEIIDSKSFKRLGIDYDRLKKEKAIRVVGSDDELFVQSEKKFPTDSGLVELYCDEPEPRYDFGQDWEDYVEKERMPYWEPTLEVADDKLAEKYPLQFLQFHSRWMTHTQWFGNETLNELCPEPTIYLSASDAQTRGIKSEDTVKVFNDRGSFKVRCVVSNGLPSGIAWIPKGWQEEQFKEGCYSVMGTRKVNPMSVNYNFYDVRVEVEKEA